MTRPGDPGHAAAARAGALGRTTPRGRAPWTLRRRLLTLVAPWVPASLEALAARLFALAPA